MDSVVKIVLVFFISLLSFSIGTFVGKKFSDNQHKMVTMEPTGSPKDPHADPPHKESEAHTSPAKPLIGHETEPMSDDQVAALEEEMAVQEDLSSQAEKAPEGSEPPKLTKVLAKEMATQGTGKFTIQIASFPTQEEAEKKSNELKSLKFAAFTTEATIKGHQWFRVNVGLFSTIKEAQDHKVQLAERAKVSTAIIQKLNQ